MLNKINLQSTALLALLLIGSTLSAQHKCKSHVHRQHKINLNPSYAQKLAEKEQRFDDNFNTRAYKKQNEIISIPVVFHVLYNKNEENISEEQIQSQLDVLNDDFRLLNNNKLPNTHPFYNLMADCEIEFCLATTDPEGNSHSGITRTYTDSAYWSGWGNEKYTSEGGHDNWDPERYLNIWVCNLDESIGTLGYATFPTELEDYPEDDGVVIHFRCFGTTGTAGTGDFEVNAGGRTTTHEVGHWLYLEHIWGDEECGTDKVDDTPPQELDNYECPSFPQNANNKCGSDENGEMFMNYMDYVDDNCMSMFSLGQKARMRSAIENFRPKLINNSICNSTNVKETLKQDNISIFPNPANSSLNIQVEGDYNLGSVRIINTTGQVVNTYSLLESGSKSYSINISDLSAGFYTLSIQTETGVLLQSFSKTTK
ncbi:MAG: T9SS type A sorting domain-containing protein [Bacteroidia bacterium]